MCDTAKPLRLLGRGAISQARDSKGEYVACDLQFVSNGCLIHLKLLLILEAFQQEFSENKAQVNKHSYETFTFSKITNKVLLFLKKYQSGFL